MEKGRKRNSNREPKSKGGRGDSWTAKGLTVTQCIEEAAKPQPSRIIEDILSSKETLDRRFNRCSQCLHDEYLKTKDPKIIIEFVVLYPPALKVEWVIDEIVLWRQTENYDLLKQTTTRKKGISKDAAADLRNNLSMVQQVDARPVGTTKTEAFKNIAESFKPHRDPVTIKNTYYYEKNKRLYYCWITEKEGTYTFGRTPLTAALQKKANSHPLECLFRSCNTK